MATSRISGMPRRDADAARVEALALHRVYRLVARAVRPLACARPPEMRKTEPDADKSNFAARLRPS